MRLSEWRPSLYSWIESNTAIAGYQLDLPEALGDTVALVPPVRNLEYKLLTSGDANGSLMQDIHLIRTYSSAIAYRNLPLGAMEGIYQTLGMRWVHDFSDIHEDITELILVPRQDAIVVSVTEDAAKHWQITLSFTLAATFYAEVELNLPPLEETYPLEAIKIDLWKTALPDAIEDTDRKDYETTLSLPPDP